MTNYDTEQVKRKGRRIRGRLFGGGIVDFRLWKAGELMVGFDAETTTMEPATTLREAFQATNPQQSLGSGDPYYVDLTKARNSHAIVHMKQTIENCGGGQY